MLDSSTLIWKKPKIVTNQLCLLGHVLALLILDLEVLIHLSEVALLQVSDDLLLLLRHHLPQAKTGSRTCCNRLFCLLVSIRQLKPWSSSNFGREGTAGATISPIPPYKVKVKLFFLNCTKFQPTLSQWNTEVKRTNKTDTPTPPPLLSPVKHNKKNTDLQKRLQPYSIHALYIQFFQAFLHASWQDHFLSSDEQFSVFFNTIIANVPLWNPNKCVAYLSPVFVEVLVEHLLGGVVVVQHLGVERSHLLRFWFKLHRFACSWPTITIKP